MLHYDILVKLLNASDTLMRSSHFLPNYQDASWSIRSLLG